MAENSAIEWTDHSWNWAQGCPKNNDSQELACKYCYMYREKSRYGQNPAVVVRSAKPTFNFPLISKKLKPGDKIFTCSWADFFNEALDPWREEAWDIIRQTPQYIYQILTKWPENIKDRLPSDWGNGWPNVWLLATIENQEMANKRVPELLQIPAAVHGVSVEPMLGSVNIKKYLWSKRQVDGTLFNTPISASGYDLAKLAGFNGLDWVICGGETGPRARPIHPDWVRSLRDQCVAAGVPFFFKSWGDWAAIDQPWKQDDIKPLKNDEDWLNNEGGCGFHGKEVWRMRRVGKKAAGALLDGQEWRQSPEVAMK